MRLTSKQIETIKQTVQNIAGCEARAILFGSRLCDEVKGGDIDLLIQSEQAIGLLQRARIKLALEETLALPVDIIAHQPGLPPTPFQQIAIEKGQAL
ncbi:MAG: Nucleotidyltransferase domain-containing protein [Candidatus Kentron sp. G]|nr:MAG: Nucleotidyltransferase domain-containing protein [Candidatus Kentron sp. G]VFN01874.1 MAG: Nucleotidyltransferase domain-containing protein [Candidatus Kentron sp. G]VFN05431.1 MAG: Nucleotidyltransferase domain-containing protein [Candidatus Kentron sp. G]